MDKNKCDCDCGYNFEGDSIKKWWKYKRNWGGGHGHLYGMGVIGALFYFLPHVTNIETAVIGIVKSIFWPALIVFKILELLKF